MEHQQAILPLLDEADRLLTSLDPAWPKALALVRWQLMRLLRTYQLFKHTEMFDPLARCGEPRRASRAASMKANCVAMAQAYGAHVETWSIAHMDAGGTEYQAATRAMVGRLRTHLRLEAAEAELLLAGVERTRRP